MSYTCMHCRYGLDRSPDGLRPPPGTVWCSKRKMQMGRNRKLSCFVPLPVQGSRRCRDCRWAKMLRPTGESPAIGKVWCERRRFEINKLRTMECFEV